MREILRRISIFESTPEDLLREIEQLLSPLSATTGQALCLQGQPGSGLFMIHSGQVKVSVRGLDGRESILGYLGPGDFFGEMSLLTGEPVSADVTALIHTELSCLDAESFIRLCDTFPILYKGISQTLSRRLRDTNLRRFESRRGKVTRFFMEHGQIASSLFLEKMMEFALAFFGEKHRPTLAIFQVETADREEISKSLARHHFLEKESSRMKWFQEGQFTSSPERQQLAQYVTSSCWASADKEVDILCLNLKEGCPADQLGHLIEELLVHFKDLYSEIIYPYPGVSYSNTHCYIPQDDHLAFCMNFTDESCQREAMPDEYNRWVPEGSRYPASPDEKHWILTRSSIEKLIDLRDRVIRAIPESKRAHVIFMHRPQRPILDYPQARKLFYGIRTYLFPTSPALIDSKKEILPRSYSLSAPHRYHWTVGAIARGITEKQVGLALGGGGARGLAHIGVIQVLEEAGIPIDILAGTSFGAVVAGAYAVGRNAGRLYHDMKYHWDGIGSFMLDFLDYNLPRTSLLRGRKIRRMIRHAMSEQTIEECPTPLYVVCADLISGREIVLDRGHLGKAIFASGSLPGIFKPVRWGNSLLVDGSILNKVPARVLRDKGAGFVIAVNVTPERDTALEASLQASGLVSKTLERIPAYRKWMSGPNILRILARSISMSGLSHSNQQETLVDYEIKPDVSGFDFLKFDQFEKIVQVGAEAARHALPAIREMLANS